MKCPYCGSSNLIWDSNSGNVVCADCGSVLDTIYDYDASNFLHSDLSELLPSYSAILLRRRKSLKQRIESPAELKYNMLFDEIKSTPDRNVARNGNKIMVNIEDLLKDELAYIAFDKITSLGILNAQLERAVLAHYLVFGYERTVKKLGGNPKAKSFLNRILKKVSKKTLILIRLYLDKKIENLAK